MYTDTDFSYHGIKPFLDTVDNTKEIHIMIPRCATDLCPATVYLGFNFFDYLYEQLVVTKCQYCFDLLQGLPLHTVNFVLTATQFLFVFHTSSAMQIISFNSFENEEENNDTSVNPLLKK